ncbi:flagellar hook-basal body complex protein FliE [Anaerosporobacter mobilis DSM 15930]|jgi:flagellar hook-basal body complex protein FliE|uniref:Flagellar hook-basal body complex protein FliE n=1 Tax=Anaerosporobacter mobilis DSM 15930 TaxID=1120996 RepID=A0A1M7EY00_9FIRM|nr:flagellar hook-basal body complex protein FliE [Anaerosporobacter mobilis]SHL96744.1 flagellar hook-basal body complex protein FliE [Anaerosporobacter mobilis DSM 15930]
MNIESIKNISSILDNTYNGAVKKTNNGTGFESLFQSALNMVNETDTLTNKAEEEAIKYSLGYSDSALDLMVAQTKANTSLQFTVAVRDKVLEAYKEIMNMQF